MGNTAVLELDSEHSHLFTPTRQRLFELEQLWSRFLATSDVSRINLSDGTPVEVAPETLLLVEHLQQAYAVTRGLFDPAILPALIASGYRASITDPTNVSRYHRDAAPGASLEKLEVRGRSVSAPGALALDAGGLGKGPAADLVVRDLLAQGAEQVCVALGGDLAFSGTPRRIEVLSPFDYAPLASLALEQGGVATSSVTAKTFKTANGTTHHVIDPRTLQPVRHDVVQVTVAASSCAWAETFAATALVSGDTKLIDQYGMAALLVRRDGSIEGSERWGQV